MIRFVAGVAEVVEDLNAAMEFYQDRLGLEVEPWEGGEYAVVKIGGIGHYGLWTRAAAAESAFGDRDRASDIPLGLLLGFEVDEVDAAAAQIGDMIQGPKSEPWGQRTARFLGPSAAVFELSETPGARELPGSG